MLIFKRQIEGRIRDRLFKGRAILIFGPRQAGKTTLAKKLINGFGDDAAYFNCEAAAVRQHFVLGEPDKLKQLVGGKKVVVFDEAQTIQDIGPILKIFIDTYPEVQIITTGSSSFDLANKINEPLTGRAFEFVLYPLSISEIKNSVPSVGEKELFELLRLGNYPAVVAEASAAIKVDLLKNLTTNYLYKDIYTFESIKNPRIFENLIKMLAWQMGALVSVNELSSELGVSRATVEKYLKLLEQSYIIKIVRAFSRNPRKEVKKAFKVYFVDVGVRNAVIDNFAPLLVRNDRGALLENLFIMERLKQNTAIGRNATLQFWKNRSGLEVDCVEEFEGKIFASECKWNDREEAKFKAFLNLYPEAIVRTIHPKDLFI